MLGVVFSSRFLFFASSGAPCPLLTSGPRLFEHRLSQTFGDLAGRGASGSPVSAEPTEIPGNR